MLSLKSMTNRPEHPLLLKRKGEDKTAAVEAARRYHSIELHDGRVLQGFHSLESLRARYQEFPLPSNLSGKRILDIGTWDGWFAFESERKGAEVVAVDNVEQETFLEAHRLLKSKVHYVVAEIYELPQLHLGTFDYTLFLGVLYHLRHPLLALDIVCGLTKTLAIVDSFVVDGDSPRDHSPIPWMEFYETTELANEIDNWVGPTTDCLLALCRSAGFARAELFSTQHRHARVACYRHWELPPVTPRRSAPILRGVENARCGDGGMNFDSTKEEFATCWFSMSVPSVSREECRPEVGNYGVPALSVKAVSEDLWAASFKLPPGLAPGYHAVRMRTHDSLPSNECLIAVDVPVLIGDFEVLSVCDSLTWHVNEVRRSPNEAGYLTMWVAGLPDNADKNNVRAHCDNTRLPVTFVSKNAQGHAQVNITITGDLGYGEKSVVISSGGRTTTSNPFLVLRTSDP